MGNLFCCCNPKEQENQCRGRKQAQRLEVIRKCLGCLSTGERTETETRKNEEGEEQEQLTIVHSKEEDQSRKRDLHKPELDASARHQSREVQTEATGTLERQQQDQLRIKQLQKEEIQLHRNLLKQQEQQQLRRKQLEIDEVRLQREQLEKQKQEYWRRKQLQIQIEEQRKKNSERIKGKVWRRPSSFLESIIEKKMTELQWDNFEYHDVVVKYVLVRSGSSEYHKVVRMFFRSFWKGEGRPKIVKILRVQNPFLLAAYELKKEEIRRRFGHVSERLLFHGTKEENVDSICTNGFNWRLHGQSRGHIFGKGVSFSPKASYSLHYCDKDLDQKVMLLVCVLVSESCIGNKSTVLPPPGYDTTQKPNGDVIVKYEDNEFYPAYKIVFTQRYYRGGNW